MTSLRINMSGRSAKEIAFLKSGKTTSKYHYFKLQELQALGFDIGDVIEMKEGEVPKKLIGKYVFCLYPPDKVFRKRVRPPKNRDTDLERKMESYLNELGFKERKDYEKQYNTFGEYRLDFAFIKERVAIEPSGNYWHGTKEEIERFKKTMGVSLGSPRYRQDRRKTRALQEKGWVVLWFYEDEISSRKEEIKELIRSTVVRRSIYR